MAKSQGEEIIAQILRETGIPFHREYSFPDLKSVKGRPLRFDFAIYNESGITTLIECQGSQHFTYVEHFSKSKQAWHMARENDLRKCRYCLMNNIPLYCIPYTDISNLRVYNDLIKEEYLVKDKWHNYTHNPNKN